MFPEAERRCLGKEGSGGPTGRLGALWDSARARECGCGAGGVGGSGLEEVG